MKWRNLIIGAGVGIAAVYLFKNKLASSYLSSEKALQIVKKEFKKKGPIDGSWIYTVPEEYAVGETTHKIYRTGVTRTVENQLEQYEALVEAETGTLLEINRIA